MQFRPEWRVAGWAANVTLPMAGLALLLARPELDIVREHHPSHFWLRRHRRTGVMRIVVVRAGGVAAGECARTPPASGRGF